MTTKKTTAEIIAMGIKVSYSDKSIVNNVYTISQVETFIKRAFKRKAEAVAEKDGQVFGRSFKQGNDWKWFVDVESLKQAGY